MSLDPVTAIADLLNKIVAGFTDAQSAKNTIAQMQQSGELQLALAQIGVNAEEAKSTNWFVAGARPFLLWVCSLSMFYDVIIFPIAVAHYPQIRAVDTTILMPILATLIGLRSWEKGKGVDTQ